MGPVRGKAQERRLVDMSGSGVEPPAYYPPPDSECEESPEFPIVISSAERIVGRAKIYRGRVVEFSISINVRDSEGEWAEVVRVDCAHSRVHIHQFYASREGETVNLIREIPTDCPDEESWQVVDAEYDSAIARLHNDFDSFVSRWRGA